MSTEIELKLQLSPKAATRLAKHPLLANIPAQNQHLLNTYFDTPGLELHQRRVAVRFRKKGWQWLCTVKSAEPASVTASACAWTIAASAPMWSWWLCVVRIHRSVPGPTKAAIASGSDAASTSNRSPEAASVTRYTLLSIGPTATCRTPERSHPRLSTISTPSAARRR